MKTISKPETVPVYVDFLNTLLYASYSNNRDKGMTHEQLTSIGIGTKEMKLKYENKILNKTKK